jgi:hypothetical protein
MQGEWRIRANNSIYFRLTHGNGGTGRVNQVPDTFRIEKDSDTKGEDCRGSVAEELELGYQSRRT